MKRIESVTTTERLPRNVIVLSWVSFFQDAASEMLYPVMPLFLTGVLGAPVAVVGIVEGLAEATASVMKVVSGRLADVRRRRPLIALGYGMSSLAKPLIGFAQVWPFVLVARLVDRTGKGIRTSDSAMASLPSAITACSMFIDGAPTKPAT